METFWHPVLHPEQHYTKIHIPTSSSSQHNQVRWEWQLDYWLDHGRSSSTKTIPFCSWMKVTILGNEMEWGKERRHLSSRTKHIACHHTCNQNDFHFILILSFFPPIQFDSLHLCKVQVFNFADSKIADFATGPKEKWSLGRQKRKKESRLTWQTSDKRDPLGTHLLKVGL